ncbi:hypothetical protein Aple_041490 [Acrocarpospora pleiomorpha]|uniref:histidine kinase n=1 Tax=Acrocarpospora pleiomorpha TaxID=90975 RepID=A0A5M3XQ03_9ACTN|nr:nitrate- and nitrite sensing domain-containing protein [Acrocarpospora pleiomorpha]GES21253.1 hypothetical protein Aple_041490 [Acrocarpospora pleiomorpha]
MRFRNSRVRAKVAALLLSLAALWAFAAWVTLREGLNLLWVSTIDEKTGRPGVVLVTALQEERRLTVTYLGDPNRQNRDALGTQRTRTNDAEAKFRQLSSESDLKFAASPTLTQRLTAMYAELDGLAPARAKVDTGQVDRARAVGAFDEIIDAAFRIWGASSGFDDEGVVRDSRTLITLTRAKELFSREDALISGAIAARRFSPAERTAFIELVGSQRFLRAEAEAELPPADRDRYQKFVESPGFKRLIALETRVAQSETWGLVAGSGEWRSAMDPVLLDLEKVILEGGDDVVERATPVAVGVILRLALAGGLGLFAVIASIILSITTARALVQQLEKLRTAALELANERLPSIVNRLAHGEKVDVATEAPPLEFGPDVIGQVGQAFNAVQETAVRTAVEEAELRQSIRDILLSLARRTQGLVHRQLTLLDVMERRESEPEELNDLFRVDHLATRMRRNAENLIVLSGASPARAWRNPVPMVDVVRGALGEVEDFTRVTIMPMGQVELTGRAVGDVIHLLAELVENAVSFSPPYTVVQVAGQMVANGYALEVEDRGLGMSAEDLAAANQRILEPPEFNLSSTARLGLFVVSRLAERHGIRVQLKASPYGGTTAVVLLPRELVVEDELVTMSAGLAGADPLDLPELPRMAVVAQQGRPTDPLDRVPEPLRQQPLAAPVATPVTPIGEHRRPELVPDTPDIPRVPEAPVPESFTPSGLPFRVPQASIAPSLRDRPVEDLPEDEDDDRSPDDIRKIMGSYQSGTQRGRSEAARLLGQQKDDEDYR